MVEDFLHLFEVRLRWGNNTAFPQNGFGDKGYNIIRSIKFNNIFYIFGAAHTAGFRLEIKGTAITIRGWSKTDSCHIRSGSFFTGEITSYA